MIGPPRSFKVALVCADSEAKGQKSTTGGSQVQALLEGNEWNVQRLQVLQHRQEMFEVAPNSIVCPAQDHLDPRAASI